MRKKLKRTFTSLVAVVILISTLLSCAAFTVSAQNAQVLRNFYVHPDLSPIKGNIRTYTVCFRTVDNKAPGTYWSLANFGLIRTDTGERLGGGYAGFQRRNNDKGEDVPVVIMSMFQSNDGNTPKCKYSMGTSKSVGSDNPSEPSCNHINEEFPWEGNRWYRMVLHCWDDKTTGTTMLGMWIQDVDCWDWTLIGYYDTLRPNVAMTAAEGDMHFFMEDFGANHKKTESYQLSGIYAKDTQGDKWKAITSVKQSYWGVDGYVKGGASIGVRNDGNNLSTSYFWGYANPTDLRFTKNDQKNKISAVRRKPNGDPDFGKTIQIKDLRVDKDPKNANNKVIRWTIDAKSTPLISYTVKIYDKNGKYVSGASGIRPGATNCTIRFGNSFNYKCELTVTDICGNTATKTIKK